MTTTDQDEELTELLERVRQTRADVAARPDKSGRHFAAHSAEAALGAWFYERVESFAAHVAGTREVAEIADDLLVCALSWDPFARLLGNVRALDIAKLCRAWKSR